MARIVADMLVATLADAGVKRIYGIVGDSLNPVTDAVRRDGRIQWVHVRHEEAGAFAASADAQLSGELVVCAGTSGPGNLHLLNGLFDCQRSHAPVLALASHIPSSEIGTGYFQETHPTLLFQECSDYCELISTPKQLPRVLQIALQTAVSRRGVAVVVLPGDVSGLPAPDAIFTADTGTPNIWAARYLRAARERRIIGSLSHGSMANALPQAIGAQMRYPGRQVVALSGDGGLSMLLGELITLHQYQLPVRVVVFDNNALAFIDLEMQAAGFPPWQTDLHNPDFAKLAETVGLLGVRIEHPGEVRGGLQRALAHEGPALIDVLVEPNALSLPPHITIGQVEGFALAMSKEVLLGRYDDVVDTIVDNLQLRP